MHSGLAGLPTTSTLHLGLNCDVGGMAHAKSFYKNQNSHDFSHTRNSQRVELSSFSGCRARHASRHCLIDEFAQHGQLLEHAVEIISMELRALRLGARRE